MWETVQSIYKKTSNLGTSVITKAYQIMEYTQKNILTTQFVIKSIKLGKDVTINNLEQVGAGASLIKNFITIPETVPIITETAKASLDTLPILALYGINEASNILLDSYLGNGWTKTFMVWGGWIIYSSIDTRYQTQRATHQVINQTVAFQILNKHKAKIDDICKKDECSTGQTYLAPFRDMVSSIITNQTLSFLRWLVQNYSIPRTLIDIFSIEYNGRNIVTYGKNEFCGKHMDAYLKENPALTISFGLTFTVSKYLVLKQAENFGIPSFIIDSPVNMTLMIFYTGVMTQMRNLPQASTLKKPELSVSKDKNSKKDKGTTTIKKPMTFTLSPVSLFQNSVNFWIEVIAIGLKGKIPESDERFTWKVFHQQILDIEKNINGKKIAMQKFADSLKKDTIELLKQIPLYEEFAPIGSYLLVFSHGFLKLIDPLPYHSKQELLANPANKKIWQPTKDVLLSTITKIEKLQQKYLTSKIAGNLATRKILKEILEWQLNIPRKLTAVLLDLLKADSIDFLREFKSLLHKLTDTPMPEFNVEPKISLIGDGNQATLSTLPSIITPELELNKLLGLSIFNHSNSNPTKDNPKEEISSVHLIEESPEKKQEEAPLIEKKIEKPEEKKQEKKPKRPFSIFNHSEGDFDLNIILNGNKPK